MATLNYASSLVTEVCISCGITFAAPKDWQDGRRKSGVSFFCPNGHSMTYGKGEAQALREQLTESQLRLGQERDQREAAQRELSRVKQRVGAGSCPCCKRHFKALSRHMACKHPEYQKPTGAR